MALNKSKGNMYPWISHTWNVIKGKCPHDCDYCYMKRYPQPELHFDEKELKTNLGSGNTIFVGSSCDMWAEVVKDIWIKEILLYCYDFNNRYLFQSKNPARFYGCLFPDDVILGTTIETNRLYANISKAPSPWQRFSAMIDIRLPKMCSIEPIMDFDLDVMVEFIRLIKPEFVSIGADSKGYGLPEPPAEKVRDLIAALKEITEVKVKSNLKRLGGV